MTDARAVRPREVALLRGNDPKLSDRSPETRVCPKRRKAKAWLVLGFMVVAQAMTEPVEAAAALPQLTAMAAVRWSAWLGDCGFIRVASEPPQSGSSIPSRRGEESACRTWRSASPIGCFLWQSHTGSNPKGGIRNSDNALEAGDPNTRQTPPASSVGGETEEGRREGQGWIELIFPAVGGIISGVVGKKVWETRPEKLPLPRISMLCLLLPCIALLCSLLESLWLSL